MEALREEIEAQRTKSNATETLLNNEMSVAQEYKTQIDALTKKIKEQEDELEQERQRNL